MSRLPEQWCLARVGDLIEMDPWNDCLDDVDIGFVPLARLGVRYRSHHTFETRKWRDVKRGYKHFANDDVLLARITPSFENGKAGIARDLPNGLGAGSTEYFVCRPISSGMLPDYLLAHFKTERFLEQGASVMSGAVGQQRVPRQFVLDSPIPLAPLNEQRRIVDKLHAVLAPVDACLECLDRVATILRRYRQSVLGAATSGKLTEAWRETAGTECDSRELLERVRDGHREFAAKGTRAWMGVDGSTRKRRPYVIPDPAHPSDTSELPVSWAWGSGGELVEPGNEIVYGIVQPGPKMNEGIRYVRGTDIQGGKIVVDQLCRTTPEIAARYSRSSLRGGDVLLGIIRSTKVAIVPAALAGSNITQGTARFRPSKVIRTKYLAIALDAPATQEWLHERYRGIDMPGLNLADVRRVPIPLPPIEEQAEIIRCVDELLSVGERVCQSYSRARNCLDRLAPSLFARAFRGELVPQDSTEEHASELLTRVRATRSEKPAAQRRTRSARKVAMPQITLESLKQAIDGIPLHRFTFNAIRDSLPGDYESLRDALFALLGEREPIVRQVFDETTKQMVLERTR